MSEDLIAPRTPIRVMYTDKKSIESRLGKDLDFDEGDTLVFVREHEENESRARDYKRVLSTSQCSTHNLCSEMTKLCML